MFNGNMRLVGTVLDSPDKEHFHHGIKFYWTAVLRESNIALKFTVN